MIQTHIEFQNDLDCKMCIKNFSKNPKILLYIFKGES